jgi:hypothetical protein
MSETACLNPENATAEIRLSEDEVIALYMNLIAFEGDWNAHLNFLHRLDGSIPWKSNQIPLIEAMQRKDEEWDLQEAISSVE